MRFILNFFFFGILFYLIWMFFPEAFLKLVSWADQVVAFFRELIEGALGKVQHNSSAAPASQEPAHAWLLLLPLLGLKK